MGDQNPRLANEMNNPLLRFMKKFNFFIGDTQLLYMLFLLACSFLGLNVNFLFNSMNMIDLCTRSKELAKVIEAMVGSYNQVFMTIILGICMQYIFVGFS